MCSTRKRLVTAAVAAVAGLGTLAAVCGCQGKWGIPHTGPPATAITALTQGASGVAAVTAHTQSAEAAVQKAVAHTTVVGQAHLATASSEHTAVSGCV